MLLYSHMEGGQSRLDPDVRRLLTSAPRVLIYERS